MTERPGSKDPEPPGGRAAERLRQFEESRKPIEPEEADEANEKTTEDATGGEADKGQ